MAVTVSYLMNGSAGVVLLDVGELPFTMEVPADSTVANAYANRATGPLACTATVTNAVGTVTVTALSN